MEEKIFQLIDNLLIKTSKNETFWERVGSTEQFILSMSGGKVSVDKLVNKEGTIGYRFSIINEKGSNIYSLNTLNKPSERVQFESVKGLYEAIVRDFFKVDQTLENLLFESKKNDFLGQDPDDLPF